jgi:hypothetical protein
MDDWAPFEALVESVTKSGIGAIADSLLMLLVPALAPFNMMSSGKQKTELTWAAMLLQPLLLGVGESSTNFATFASSAGPSAQRLQQLLRTLGRVPFAFAAADNAAVDLARQLGNPQLLYARLWLCSSCASLPVDPVDPPPVEPPWDCVDDDPARVSCPACRERLVRLHRFLTLPLALLLAAVKHANTFVSAWPWAARAPCGSMC